MKQSTVIGLFLGTIKAQTYPDYLFGNLGELTTFSDNTCGTMDPAQQSDADKQAAAMALGNALNTYKVCTAVPDTTPQDYQMITVADDTKIEWTLFSDETCTTKKSQDTPDPNQLDISLATPAICNAANVNPTGKKDFQMVKKNGYTPSYTCGTTEKPYVIGQCTLYDDDACATESKVDGGKDQTDETKMNLGTEVNNWFKDAFNKCADIQIGGSAKTPIYAQCPPDTNILLEYIPYDKENTEASCDNNTNGGNTVTFKADTCTKLLFTPEGGAEGQSVKCKADQPFVPPPNTCENFSFQSCEEFSDAACNTSLSDQTEATMQANAKTIIDTLKPTFAKCVDPILTDKAIRSACTDNSITWNIFAAGSNCATGTPTSVTATKGQCFTFSVNNKNYKCDVPDVPPGPTPPTPGRNDVTNGTESNDGITVKATMAAATIGAVAATLF